MSSEYYDLWETAPDKNSGTGSNAENDPDIPDGQHRAIISDFSCCESKQGDVWMKFVFTVVTGMYDGRTLVRMVAPLGRRGEEKDWRERQVQFARQDLRTVLGSVPTLMGDVMDPGTKTTGPAALHIRGAVVSVTRKTTQKPGKDVRINVYIDELISAPAQPEEVPFPGDGDAPEPKSGGAPPARFGLDDPEEEVPF